MAELTSELGVSAAHQTIGATVSIMRACELAGVSRRTIYNWIAQKKVTVFRTAGGNVRLLRSELVKLDRAAE